MKLTFTKILNYIGLTIAFATFAVLMVQIEWDMTYAKKYPDADRVYRYEFRANKEDNFWVYADRVSIRNTANIPGVEEVGTMQLDANTWFVSREEDSNAFTIETHAIQMDSHAMNIMGVKMVEGTREDMDSVYSVFITTEAAKKIFDDESPVGQMLYISDSNPFTISGVIEPLPANGVTPPFDFVFSFANNKNLVREHFNYHGYIKVLPNADVKMIEAAMKQNYRDLFSDMYSSKEQQENIDTRLTPIAETHYVMDTNHDMIPKGRRVTLYTLIAMACIVILIAFINFLNITMAEMPTKIKSINTRRILGAPQMDLIWMQCKDAIKISLFAVITAIGVVYLIGFTRIADAIDGSIMPHEHAGLYIGFVVMAIVVSVIAGLYPAIYSTSVQPALLLRGNFSHSDKGRLMRNALVGIQFVVSLILIIYALFIQVQTTYMNNYDKGFESDAVIECRVPNCLSDKRQALSEILEKRPEVTDHTFAAFDFFNPKGTNYGMMVGYKIYTCSFDVMPVDDHFLDFFGIQIVEGRGFRKGDMTSEVHPIIFNEIAKAKWELELGANMNQTEVIGFAKNYNYKPLQMPISPIALQCVERQESDWWYFQYLYMKKSPGVTMEQMRQEIAGDMMKLDATVKDSDISLKFLDDKMQAFYEKEATLSNLLMVSSIISIIIAIIGILGLVHYETRFRKKEIAIRRVLGSGIVELLALFNRIYIIIALVCFVISIPAALWIIDVWVKEYPFQSPVPIWIFAVALIVLLVIIITTVSIKSYKAATDDPVDAIKAE